MDTAHTFYNLLLLTYLQVVSFLASKTQTYTVVRTKHSAGKRVIHRKPVKPWADPKDTSWAAPILKYAEQKARTPDPEPTMLHMVYRIKEMTGRPYWDKDMLKELGLYDKVGCLSLQSN